MVRTKNMMINICIKQKKQTHKRDLIPNYIWWCNQKQYYMRNMNCQAWWCNRLVVKPPVNISGTWSSLFDRDWMSLSFWGPWAWAEIQSPCRFHVVKACDRAAFCRGHTSHHNTGDVEMSDSSIQHSTLVAGHHSCKLAYKANEYYSCFHYHKSNSETGDICPDLAIVNGGPTLDDLVCQHWSALTMGPWGSATTKRQCASARVFLHLHIYGPAQKNNTHGTVP